MNRASASIVFAFAAWMCVFAAGCAAPGDPTARHPVVPVAVADLSARQVGVETVLAFTLPARSTDGEALAERPSVEVYRAAPPTGAAVATKTSWALAFAVPPERVDAYVRNNRFEFHDPLAPATLGAAPGPPLIYMVRTRAVRARASGDSNVVTLRIYPPPMTPGDVRTQVTESAIAIHWSETGAPAGATFVGYHVYRALAEPGQPSAAPDASQTKLKSPPELLGAPASGEYQDSHFEFGQTYVYTVRSVAAFGADLLESADSLPASVTPRDIFPPAAPVGLEAAVVPATPQGASYVELSWAISAEPDLAGYRVYRSGREDATGERLNTELLPSPAFRDMSVMPGEQYFYRVSAVDRSGNESPMSFAISAQVP